VISLFEKLNKGISAIKKMIPEDIQREKSVFNEWFKRKIVDLARKKIPRLKTPMDMVILTLKAYNILPKPLIALDLFGGHGLLVTADYVPYCDYFEMWEIIPLYAKFAKRFLPKAVVNVGDSIKAVKEGKLLRRDYNFIVIDNPQGIFNEATEYCEYFDLFPEIFNYIDVKKTFFVTNASLDVEEYIKTHPYFSAQLDKWLKKRKEFYNMDAKKIYPEQLEKILRDKFKNWGVKVKKYFFIPRTSVAGFQVIEVEK
jgi:hypothetical protein